MNDFNRYKSFEYMLILFLAIYTVILNMVEAGRTVQYPKYIVIYINLGISEFLKGQ